MKREIDNYFIAMLITIVLIAVIGVSYGMGYSFGKANGKESIPRGMECRPVVIPCFTYENGLVLFRGLNSSIILSYLTYSSDKPEDMVVVLSDERVIQRCKK